MVFAQRVPLAGRLLELDYSLGPLINSWQVRPARRVIARTVEEHRGRTRRPALRTTAVVVGAGDDATAPRRSTRAPGGVVFEAVAGLTADGVRPMAALASNADDAQHLAARGITGVVTPEQVR
ncbi:hypothetical protein [Streptomyces sp. LN549]|uniref:hypothetical protein n=1 Tax=Streptomyces sp. LN549 TaxID=3112979 RepID=UPI003712D735